MHAPDKDRIKSLDGLRAIAMILVLFSHSTWRYTDHISSGPELFGLIHILYNGWVGVELFFVLSGFLIASQLLTKSLTPQFYKSFALRRFFRIAPAYYVAIFATLFYLYILPVLFYGQDVDLFAKWRLPILSHVFFVHDYFARDPMIDGIFWSIPIEMKFYLILPFLLYFLTKIQNSKRQLITIVAFYICYAVFKFSYLYSVLGTESISYSMYFFHIKTPFHFALDSLIVGVFCAFFLNNAYIRSLAGHTKTWDRLFSIALICYFIVAIYPYFTEMRADFFERFGPRALFSLIFGAGLIALVKGCNASAFFGHPAFAYMAKISYSVYLMQIFALAVQDAMIWKLSQYIESGFWCWVLSLPFLFLTAGIIGHLMYAYVEKPFIRWSKEKWPSR